MRPHKSTILIMLLGLLLVAFAAVMAQTPQQTGEQKKPADAAMESCCKGDSCSMKKEGADTGEAKEDCCADSCKHHQENANKNSNDTAKPKPENAKGDAAGHPECCGESCDMSKHDMANHENHDKKGHSADGSCCKAKQKDAKKVKTN